MKRAFQSYSKYSIVVIQHVRKDRNIRENISNGICAVMTQGNCCALFAITKAVCKSLTSQFQRGIFDAGTLELSIELCKSFATSNAIVIQRIYIVCAFLMHKLCFHCVPLPLSLTLSSTSLKSFLFRINYVCGWVTIYVYIYNRMKQILLEIDFKRASRC